MIKIMRNKYLIPGKAKNGIVILDLVQRPCHGGWYGMIHWKYNTTLYVPRSGVATPLCATRKAALDAALELWETKSCASH